MKISLSMNKIPEGFTRSHQVLVVVTTGDGKVILGEKHAYPDGIVRLPGGGVEVGEDAATAAVRECAEELGITIQKNDLEQIAHLHHVLTTASNETYNFHLDLFYVKQPISDYHPSDDLDGAVEYNHQELAALVRRYHQLPPEIDPNYDFAWSDYGALYGPVHQLALDFLTEKRYNQDK